MEEEDDAGSTQTGEVLAEETEPEGSLTGCTQGCFQLGRVLREILVAHGLHVAVVLIAHAAHHQAECAVVLDVDLHVEVLWHADVLLDEVENRLGTLLAQELVEACGTFGRSCAAKYHVGKFERVAVDEGEHFGLQLHDKRVILGQVVLIDGEDDLAGQVVELFVGNLYGVGIPVDEADEGIVAVGSGIDSGGSGEERGVRAGASRFCPKRNAEDKQNYNYENNCFRRSMCSHITRLDISLYSCHTSLP